MDPSDSLTDKDHRDLTAFLAHAFEDCRSGRISVEDGVSAVAHVMTALDGRQYGEVRNWLQQGRKFVRRTGA